ncbi:Uncharacterised protein [Neisseria gonorrhoeae]|uniref:Uncharacterized protein n=1 Tax=Neisseria gonorrhoeae TaxID=485 RepID=A0A378VTF1_NEIGO|nr:Uncharacterised protein [Neisseria gonorrhoeae]
MTIQVFLIATRHNPPTPILRICHTALFRSARIRCDAAGGHYSPLSLWERARKLQGLYFRRLRDLGKIVEIRGALSPTGEGAGCGRFGGCRRFENRLDLQPLISGRLKSKSSLHNLISLQNP